MKCRHWRLIMKGLPFSRSCYWCGNVVYLEDLTDEDREQMSRTSEG